MPNDEKIDAKRAKVALMMIEWMHRKFCLWCHAGVDQWEEYEELLRNLGVEDSVVKAFIERGRECWYTQDLLDSIVPLIPDK
jgi:hypothetical protein